MKTRSLLIPMILVTSAAIGDARADAQAQASALLSPSHTSSALKADPQERRTITASPVLDAQARAAALLGGTHTGGPANVDVARTPPSAARMSGDAQAQAAALLGGSRTFTDSRLRAQQTHGGGHTSGRDRIHEAPCRVPPKAELIQFHHDRENAVLDSHKAKAPTLQRMREPTLNGVVTSLSTD